MFFFHVAVYGKVFQIYESNSKLVYAWSDMLWEVCGKMDTGDENTAFKQKLKCTRSQTEIIITTSIARSVWESICMASVFFAQTWLKQSVAFNFRFTGTFVARSVRKPPANTSSYRLHSCLLVNQPLILKDFFYCRSYWNTCGKKQCLQSEKWRITCLPHYFVHALAGKVRILETCKIVCSMWRFQISQKRKSLRMI